MDVFQVLLLLLAEDPIQVTLNLLEFHVEVEEVVVDGYLRLLHLTLV